MSVIKVEEDSVVAVFGFGVTGRAVVKSLLGRGIAVVVFDDSPTSDGRAYAESFGIPLIVPSDNNVIVEHMRTVNFAMPTPGLPETHFFFEYANEMRIPVTSEFDLAGLWDQRPIVAITGTNGKTTVTTMVAEMLEKSNIVTAIAGNAVVPLVTAIENKKVEKFVVEASSFRLAQSQFFKPQVAAWLNFAPDHLDVHMDLNVYEQAKKSIWQNVNSTDVAVANIDDDVVRRNLPQGCRTATFGLRNGDSRLENGKIVINGTPLLEVSKLARSAPHDILNALAAATIAAESGAVTHGITEVLTNFSGLPHRMTYLGSAQGVGWYNDSKSTTPHSVAAAVQNFESVVLIVGGQNKGIDLTVLRLLSGHLKAVITIGEAAEEITEVFRGDIPTDSAETMDEAIVHARARSESGDVVILSPGCASFDWYENYKERGRHFSDLVTQMVFGCT
jgi:UDP-N-acetylmuramoylalanine--D-glutamate ligase